MPSRFSIKRRVAFSKADVGGIVNLANYYRQREDTEPAFYRSLGFKVHSDLSALGCPRIKATY